MPFFGGGGAAVDLASPSAIGSTTPNTGAFTTLSFAPAANATGLSSSSYSLTGSNAQSLVSLSGTWNTTGTPSAILLNITNTASNSNSNLINLQTGGTTRFRVRQNGWTYIGTYLDMSGGGLEYSSNVTFVYGGALTTVSGHLATDNNNTKLFSDANDVWAMRDGTSANTLRIYRTFTDASNYERLGLITTRTTRFAIAAENAGTGAARSLEISFYTSASDPTSTDITDGCFSVWKNSGTSTIKLWANDGGTIKSVALA